MTRTRPRPEAVVSITTSDAVAEARAYFDRLSADRTLLERKIADLTTELEAAQKRAEAAWARLQRARAEAGESDE